MGAEAQMGEFAVSLPMTKVWRGADGTLRFEGVASSTRLDRQKERMTPNAIRKMATQTGLDLLPSHDAGALEELGVVEEAWVDNDQFRIAGRLDESNPEAVRLFEKVSQGRRYGLSVGGRVTKAFWRHDDEAGRQIRFIDDVELDHVAVCRPAAAANPDTYLSTLAKAAEGMTEPAPDGEDEAAMLARVGRAAVQAARSLWPFAKSEVKQMDDGGEELAEELAAMRALRKSVEDALARLNDALEKMAEGAEDGELAEAEADESEEPTPGVSRAIAGQERSAGGDMWSGVV